jgi:hypothetical protein
MPMSAHALLCRACYNLAGGTSAPIYKAAAERGEASPRSTYYARSGAKIPKRVSHQRISKIVKDAEAKNG